MKYAMKSILFVALSANLVFAADHRAITVVERKELIQAISDEIYDYGYHNEYYQIGENVGSSEQWISQLHIYVNPTYNSANNYGEVIYKLMPYGQVYRLFEIGKDGEVHLIGDPDNHFPITQPSHLTVYMDEDDVCRFERTWLKDTFVINVKPSADVLHSAAQRQKKRTGFSNLEDKRLILPENKNDSKN